MLAQKQTFEKPPFLQNKYGRSKWPSYAYTRYDREKKSFIANSALFSPRRAHKNMSASNTDRQKLRWGLFQLLWCMTREDMQILHITTLSNAKQNSYLVQLDKIWVIWLKVYFYKHPSNYITNKNIVTIYVVFKIQFLYTGHSLVQ